MRVFRGKNFVCPTLLTNAITFNNGFWLSLLGKRKERKKPPFWVFVEFLIPNSPSLLCTTAHSISHKRCQSVSPTKLCPTLLVQTALSYTQLLRHSVNAVCSTLKGSRRYKCLHGPQNKYKRPLDQVRLGIKYYLSNFVEDTGSTNTSSGPRVWDPCSSSYAKNAAQIYWHKSCSKDVGETESWGQFYHHSMSSFYVRRSQKRK